MNKGIYFRRRWGRTRALLAVLLILLNLQRLLADPTTPNPGEAGPVVINEFLAANGGGFLDEDGDPSDWIELYNRTATDINLVGWSLSDDPTRPTKWVFEDDLVIPGGGYLLVMASGKDRSQIDAEDGERYVHTNFRLNSQQGFLALYSPTSRRFMDASAIEYGQQFEDVSYGRIGDGYGYLANPTPGAANDTDQVWQDLLPAVQFSPSRGFYDEPFLLTLSVDDPEAVIRYTTDGSTPTEEHGHLYREPIPITTTTAVRAAAFRPGYRPGLAVTHTYIFPADVARQPAEPPGFPATWGTHAIDFGGYQAGTPQEADYAMDPRIVEDPRYGPMVQEGLLALPTISLVTDQDALFEIYSRPRDRGREMERPVSVEWIDPQGQVPDFQLNAGLRIQGGAGRWEFMPKHSFRLFFRREYGAAYLTVPIFANSPVDRFDTLILRGGVDRSFAGHPWAPDNPIDHRLDTYARDEWARASQIAMSGLGSHGRFVHLYLNGLYWGIYNLVERPDESFAAAYLGGQKEEWSSANHSGPVSGPQDRINVLIQLAQAGGLADPEKYATMLEFIDPIQFSDYIILNWYAGNRDWPENNWYVVVQNPAGRNLFFVWDAERTWEDGAAIVLGSDGFEGAPYPNVVKRVFTALMENPEFRLLFADRLYRHLYHDGALSQKNALARWEAITAPLEKAIAAESARWGDVRYPEPITPDDWQRARALVAEQMVGNADRLMEMARAQGFYPPIDPPTFSQQGGTFADRLALTLSAPEGEIYYTLDGSDPRQPGTGQVAPGARRYQGDPLLLTTATTVKARVKVLKIWLPSTVSYDTLFDNVFGRYLNRYELVAIETVQAGTLTELVYSVEMKRPSEAQEFLSAIGNLNGNNRVVLITGQQEVDL